MTEPRVIVFGYSEVGYECLELLLRRKTRVVAVFTHEDKPDENLWFRSVAGLAREHDVPVFTPDSLKTPETEEQLQTLRPDVIFSFYYRNMIPMRLLNLAPLGAFNMHGSLLPKYRGKAPVNWAVLNGESQIGATLHHMVQRADAGAIVDQEAVAIGPEETAIEVMKKVQAAALKVLERQLNAILTGHAPRHPQDETQATYFGARKPEDGRIDWHQPVINIFNLIRAVTRPYPGAFTDCGDARLMIWRVQPPGFSSRGAGDVVPGQVISLNPFAIATGDGILQITDCQWVNPQQPAQQIAPPQFEVGQVLSAVGEQSKPLTLKTS
ncbi:MAG: formyltransferase [Verrucomicrobia bacterium]|nr:formyltransferase [Verrucomicrobiota bacterium]